MVGEGRRIGRDRIGRAPARLLCSASLSALALVATPGAAQAEDRYWDPNGFNVNAGGNGNWNTTGEFWSESDSDVLGLYHAWNNDPLNPDNAIFGTTNGVNTVGTITLTEPITVHNITFQTVNNWVLNGGVLTLAGTTPTIHTVANTTINSQIAGTAGLTRTGTHTLYLTGENTFSGGITISGTGYLRAQDDAALGDPSNDITATGTGSTRLRIDSGTTNRTVTIESGVDLFIYGPGAGSAFYTGEGTLLASSFYGNLTLSNNNNDFTGDVTLQGCSGICTVAFTSVGNAGEASALGAGDTVTLARANAYSDIFAYVGDGDSSDRSWSIGPAIYFLNSGSGTLSLTGDIAMSGTTFTASSADFDFSNATISGTSAVFDAGSVGRTITLGGANTYTGATNIAGDSRFSAGGTLTVYAPVLANSGDNSSFGTGNIINLQNRGTLSYTGTGSSSDRSWTSDGATWLRNDGTGALTLSGGLSFVAGGTDTLTLGGDYIGTNIFSGVVSGTGNLAMDGAGTWVLSGANTRTGTIEVLNGTLQAGHASAFGTTTGVIVNGGTLDLDDFSLATRTLNGTGGTIDLGNATLTVNGNTASSYAGTITGTGGLTKLGQGTLTLSGANSYTGSTDIGGGRLALDFTAATAPTTNIIAGGSALRLSGGSLVVTGADGEDNIQNFGGVTITAGANAIRATSGADGTMTVNLGAISRTSGLVDFTLPTDGAITTTNSALGGWATVNGTDYAKVVGNVIMAFDETDYTDQDDASLWGNGQYVSDSDNDAESFFGIVGSNLQLNGLQYTTPAESNVEIASGVTLTLDGAIIVAPTVLENDQTITGGNITGTAGGVLGVLQNGGGTFTIDSTIIDNGGLGFTKGGQGTVALTGLNSYTGATVLTAGRLEVDTIADGLVNSSIGASDASSDNLILQGGVLAYTGGDTASDRGFTLVNGGAGNPTIEVGAGIELEFSGLVTSPDDAGLIKTGAGTLTLSNDANDYLGVTTIQGGTQADPSTIAIDTITNGGVASGIGAAGSASSNLVLKDGGRLEYTGIDAGTDRGFTLDNGGRIGVTDVDTLLTVSGTITGTGPFQKDGAGTLLLSAANNYTGGTIVNGGTLQAGNGSAFGSATALMTVNSPGILDLNGFNISVGGLEGDGSVDLTNRTLTLNGVHATFTGVISGSGGLTKGSSGRQIFTGCGHDYTGVTTLDGIVRIDCIADAGQASGIGASSNVTGGLVFAGDGELEYDGGDAITNRGFTLQSSYGRINVMQADTELTFTGVVTGGGDLVKEGPGQLILTGSNTYTGHTHVTEGLLLVGSATALGTTASFQMTNAASAVLDLNDNSYTTGYLNGGGTLGGDIDLGSGTLTLNYNGGTTQFYGGDIIGTGGFTKAGHANFTQVLSSCTSDYDGPTTINGGTLDVKCLANGGLASSIGDSGSAASNLVLNGGTLTYSGTSAAITDRQFTLGTGGGGLGASGVGAGSTVNFTYAGAITTPGVGNRTFTLTGTHTGDNVLAAQIVNPAAGGVTSLTKTGVGTWRLSNSGSTYTGVTTISGGVLSVDKLSDGEDASSIGASTNVASNLVIGSGATLRYTGTGDTTDRLFTLQRGTTAIESSGTGAIEFTNEDPIGISTAGSGARVLSLGGTYGGDNIMGASIRNESAALVTSLAKSGTGKWILTGTNTYTGNTNVNQGTLVIGDGLTSGSIASANSSVAAGAVLGFDRADTVTFGGLIAGAGAVHQLGSGTTILTGTNTYSGGTTIAQGTLQLGGGGLTGSIVGNVTNDGTLTFNRSNSYTFTGVISGSGQVRQIGAGTTILTGNSTYTGGTTITAGTLQIGNGTTGMITGNVTNNSALVFNRSNAATFDGAITGTGSVTKQGAGMLTLTGDSNYSGGTTITAGMLQIGNGGDTGSITGNVVNNAALIFNRSNDLTYAGLISGSGTLTKQGAGILTLTGNNSYTGTTTIGAGTLQIGGGGTTGSIASTSIVNNAALIFNRLDNITYGGAISGTGSLTKLGVGVLTLTGANSYTGITNVNVGTLLVNGTKSGPGATNVASGAILGGTGSIAGTVNVAGGGILAPGAGGPGTLTIGGALSLADGAILNMEFGEADTVGGDLNDLIVVGGNLVLDGTLNVATAAGGAFDPGVYRVINYGGTLTNNGFALGTMPDGSDVELQTSVGGQVNIINSAGLTLNFWDGDLGPKGNGAVNGGTGTWQSSGGNNNWTNAGGTINAGFTDAAFAIFQAAAGTVTVDNSVVPVTASGMQFATNGYVIDGGDLTLVGPQSILKVGDNSLLGAGYTATVNANLVGATQLVKTDLGTLVLAGTNGYTGGTAINGGTLQIASDANLGHIDGDLSFDGGTLRTTADIATGRDVALAGAGTFLVDSATALTIQGIVSGGGALTKSGDGTLILAADNSYTGGTTIGAGTLRIGAGGTTGSITGDVTNNAALVFDRLGELAYAGAISGTGTVTQAGAGTTILTGANSYTGETSVTAGTLLVNGNQGSANGNTTVAAGATLGGIGTIGSSLVTVDGNLTPGSNGVGTLTIAGDLVLGSGAQLDFELGAAGAEGGAFNDLINVAGDLTLDGTLNVAESAGGTFGAGIYRLINYGGTLTDEGLGIGTIAGGADVFVQTSIDGQVNLVNSEGLALNFWDGDAGPKFNNAVNGGSGTWQSSAGNNNWTNEAGSINAPYADGGFAVFQGVGGSVTIDNSLGNVAASGMQFAANGYVIEGGDLTLVGPTSTVRVGDGSDVGAGFIATIESNIVGSTQLVKDDLGTLILSGVNSYTGGTAINAGTLRISSDGNLGDVGGNLSFDGGTLHTTADIVTGRGVALVGNGAFLTDPSTELTIDGVVSGAGALTKDGAGTLILTGANGWDGGTTIAAGTLQVGNGGTSGSITGDVLNDGLLVFNRLDEITFAGTITGSGALEQMGDDRLILTADNSYTGGTTITSGVLQLGDGTATGSIVGDVVNHGVLAFDRSDEITFGGLISGDGGVDQLGGTTILTGDNSYLGATNVVAGTLLINGAQLGATGLTSVAAGATLGGIGTIGGTVDAAGTIAPGIDGVGTLTIGGNLILAGGAKLDFDFGQANQEGGPLNDLLEVTGNVTLAGSIDVTVTPGGSFDPGIYRVINYGGDLTNGGFTVGTVPPGNDVSVQTVIDGQVNLVNAGAFVLKFWDAGSDPKPNDAIDGGTGLWQSFAGNNNWTEEDGSFNGGFTDQAFAIFQGTAGTVTVDNSVDPVVAAGMQFAVTGYTVDGETLTLVGLDPDIPQSVIRVGDGTEAGAAYVATISAELTGATQLVKSDLGTLILSGINSYDGGTLIEEGTLQISSADNLGSGDLSFDGGTLRTTADITDARAVALIGSGTVLTDDATTLTWNGLLSGDGALTKTGEGTLVLTANNSYAGGTAINGGVVQISSDANLGAVTGGLSFDGGVLHTTADFSSSRLIDLVGNGNVRTDAGTTLTLDGVVSGAGLLTKGGEGTLILAADNSYTGGTSIVEGTLQIGDGGSSGSILGDVDNGARLAFDRLDELTFGGTISGIGSVEQAGAGTTILTGSNSYTGNTIVTAGTLLINGNQSLATGPTNVASAATLGGIGTIGGNVTIADGGILAAGSNGVGLLTIDGDLALGATSIVAMEFGDANFEGGPLNDLINVVGNLELGGRLDVSVPDGGTFGPGLYRVINYTGSLLGGDLTAGTMPDGSEVFIQTSVEHQVNLVNTAGLTLNFWDGDAGPTFNDNVDGGNGTWNTDAEGDNWTDENGVVNAAYANGAFAIFQGAAGTVTVDNSIDPVTAAGMQFAVDGYVIDGGPLTLVGPDSFIRVGDGTPASAGFTAAIEADLGGDTRLIKDDLGTLILTGNNGYTGGTLIAAGTLQVGAGGSVGSIVGNVENNGGLVFNRSDEVAFGGTITGSGSLEQMGADRLILTADNGYTGGTTISSGILQLGDGNETGSITGNVVNEGELVFNRSNALTFAGLITGDGAVSQIGGGTTILTGSNAYLGATNVTAGTLLINGDQSLADGLTSVGAGATLGGIGTIGGDVAFAGGILAPGSQGVGTLTIAGDLSLDAASVLAFEFGEANVIGGAWNDLVDVAGNLALAGTINVAVPTGGSFDPGVYRVFNYGGSLSGSGLTLGTLPEGSDVIVQTSVLGEVNLVNSGGATLTFWDGDLGPKFNRVVDGGDGIWQNGSGNDNWTESSGGLNGAYTDGAFAIFSAAPGTVTVDNSLGAVTASGMQFVSSGYVITGEELGLVGDEAVIRVGDGTDLGADYVATIAAELTGGSSLVKTDLGTLILTGNNSYTGNTLVEAGNLVITGDQSLATGLTSVMAGSVLGGTGIIGGDVVIADGGTIAPGESPGTLTINGKLSLVEGSVLDFEFGEADVVGGAFNDLIEVGGDLVLDGTINVTVPEGGSFGAGIYRVINYGGTLTDNGLALGTMPTESDPFVQTSVAGQVNLVNLAGMTLGFWDGDAGPKFNDEVNGGDGLWQSSLGNDNWTNVSGSLNAAYADADFAIFTGEAGSVTVDNSLGDVTSAGMQFAVDGYVVDGDALTLVGDEATIRVGDASDAGAEMTATIEAELTGTAKLVKTDLGTLVLTGTNSYSGGTAINGGTVRIASDANLGNVAGDLNFDGGTLHTTDDIVTTRDAVFTGAGTFLTDADTTLTFDGLISGAGAMTKAGAGTLLLTADSSGYTGNAQLAAGTTVVNGVLGGSLDILAGARLEGTGTVGDATNRSGAIIAPGNDGFGTLIVDGNYAGLGGMLEMEVELGGDGSQADRLAVTGASSGTTIVDITNIDGAGAPTEEGIKIVDVAGASGGSFLLDGVYLFNGKQAIVAGAYGYTLEKNGIADPADGDWYLRSSAASAGGGGADGPTGPLYQPGVPVYEAFGQTLLAMNRLPTWRQRVGARQWAPTADAANQSGFWGRIEGSMLRPESDVSSARVDTDIDSWSAQAGLDHALEAGGGIFILGVTGHYGEADAGVESIFGSGNLDIGGYGVGGTLTWYGDDGFYADAQAQFSWYEGDLRSSIFGALADDVSGDGQAFSLEIGKETALGRLSITPQAQLTYATVDFDRFVDPMDASVAGDRSESLKARVGMSIDHLDDQGDNRSHLYGIANIGYELLDGARVDVAGARLANRDDRLWGEIGGGGSISWGNVSLYTDVTVATSLGNFGDSYNLKGTAGLRVKF